MRTNIEHQGQIVKVSAHHIGQAWNTAPGGGRPLAGREAMGEIDPLRTPYLPRRVVGVTINARSGEKSRELRFDADACALDVLPPIPPLIRRRFAPATRPRDDLLFPVPTAIEGIDQGVLCLGYAMDASQALAGICAEQPAVQIDADVLGKRLRPPLLL